MHKKILTAAAVVTLIAAPAAAFAAGSGAADAGRGASHGTVTGADVVNESLTGKDVKNGSVRMVDLGKGVQQQLTDAPDVTRVSALGLASSSSATSFEYSVACPAGTTVVSGGAYATSPGSVLTGTFPGLLTNPQGQGWTGAVSQPSGGVSLAVTVFALCQSSS